MPGLRASQVRYITLALLLGAGLATAASARLRSPATTMPEGTFLLATLERSISTVYARTGDPVELRTIHRVWLPDGGEVPAGTTVAGEVLHARAGSAGAAPELMLRFTSLVIDGDRYAIASPPLEVHGRCDHGTRARGPSARWRAAVATHGSELVLPAGKFVRVRLLEPVRVPSQATLD